MVDFHKLKNLGTDIRGRAGEIAEQAKEKVVPLAEQAKEKVVPLAGQAKEKVVPLAGKAKDVAAKGVDKAAEGLDSATGHKFHDKLGDVTGNREKNPTGPAGSSSADSGSPADVSVTDPATDDTAMDTTAGDTAVSDLASGDAAAAGSGDEASQTVPSAEASDNNTADSQPELLITTDDGSLHHPTPADMPQHRSSDDPS
jgi:hypothetical protein